MLFAGDSQSDEGYLSELIEHCLDLVVRHWAGGTEMTPGIVRRKHWDLARAAMTPRDRAPDSGTSCGLSGLACVTGDG